MCISPRGKLATAEVQCTLSEDSTPSQSLPEMKEQLQKANAEIEALKLKLQKLEVMAPWRSFTCVMAVAYFELASHLTCYLFFAQLQVNK